MSSTRCAGTLVPFVGKCHVGYIPSGKVLGLSKVARIVDMYARRLQIQETLVTQIADSIKEVTDALGVAVIIEAKHMCMMMRGVEKQNSVMKTSGHAGSISQQPGDQGGVPLLARQLIRAGLLLILRL